MNNYAFDFLPKAGFNVVDGKSLGEGELHNACSIHRLRP